MRLFLLTALTMVAFAANSVINRAALTDGAIGPASFAFIRLATGALLLVIILRSQGTFQSTIRPRIDAVIGLILYAICFSFAYLVLEAGLGALLLFGMVQITMFGGAVLKGNRPRPLQWAGAAIGLLGLGYVLNPTTSGIDITGALLMVVAGFGWGIYSLAGQKAVHALTATATSFVCATPIAAIVWLLSSTEMTTSTGIALACLSGVVTSGLGYVLWFYVLPQLQTSTAAVAQLTVPLIAMVGGMLFLGEAWTLDFTIASVLVLGGIGLSVWAGQRG
ncbi:DMT family transporter [Amylibacter sp. SFDW26]|uniref:DMT family transporter n=1 Tax=Amylibacter sp. SFDW26 TaxID=2652722 RepID=UPI0012617CF2|nr:DMT family transporter [Amylibacter sp. SFDW26]KAB7610440.1 DMT family transporter [Amylibacter sp. SFDW26]